MWKKFFSNLWSCCKNTFQELGQDLKNWFSTHKKDFVIGLIIIGGLVIFILIVPTMIRLTSMMISGTTNNRYVELTTKIEVLRKDFNEKTNKEKQERREEISKLEEKINRLRKSEEKKETKERTREPEKTTKERTEEEIFPVSTIGKSGLTMEIQNIETTADTTRIKIVFKNKTDTDQVIPAQNSINKAINFKPAMINYQGSNYEVQKGSFPMGNNGKVLQFSQGYTTITTDLTLSPEENLGGDLLFPVKIEKGEEFIFSYPLFKSVSLKIN